MGDEGQNDIQRQGSDGGARCSDKTISMNKSNAGGLLVDLFSEENTIGSGKTGGQRWHQSGSAGTPGSQPKKSGDGLGQRE